MSKYQPKQYHGEVLLQLAAERPPHMDFLPGWQAVITGKLHVQHLDAHKRDLTKAENMRIIAGAIGSHILLASEEKSLPRCVEDSRPMLMPALRPAPSI
jgi:hypothetical protein